MKNQEINKLKNWASQFFQNDSKALDIFDIEAEIDRSLSVEENKTILREKIKHFVKEFPKRVMDKKEYEQKVQQQLNQFEEQAEKEFNRVLEKIGSQETTKTIDDVYFIPKQYTKMVANGFSRGFLLYGETAIGKTYSVMRAFKEANKKFVMLSGHITALELYHFLFEHRKENIVLDDVNILETEQNLNMLKACLSDNSRVVSYHTSSSKLRVPNKFVFEGSMIILLNKIPKQAESLKAVESRILTYEMKLDYKTKIKIIFELAKQEYKGISQEHRQEIANWIHTNTSRATENLNLRLLFLCYEFFRYNKESWIKLSEKTIKTDELLQMVVQGVGQEEFCDKTGLGRATFYRLKKKVSKSHEKPM